LNNLTVNIIKIGSKASSILDLMRFFFAFIVFLFHFYVPLPGYQAVMVFFVLSGYFISATILKSLKENRWSWSEYFLKRVIRLWIVLLPC
jgi:peptidoglycan/LPS O-acetylase OafA/YrhL